MTQPTENYWYWLRDDSRVFLMPSSSLCDQWFGHSIEKVVLSCQPCDIDGDEATDGQFKKCALSCCEMIYTLQL